jgi:type II secretion system protein N
MKKARWFSTERAPLLRKERSNRPTDAGLRLGGRWTLIAYGIFAGILFLSFVTASFPYADTISAMLAPMKLRVVFQSQSMNFPIGARLQNVRLISTASQQLLLQSPDVTVMPRLAWFFVGHPCLRVRARIYGGFVDATVRQRQQAVDVDFAFASLNLASTGELQQLRGALTGELSGIGSAHLAHDITAGSASMILRGYNVKLVLVHGLPPLELGAINGKVALRQGTLTLRDVTGRGSDCDLEASGDIQLARTAATSTIKLNLSLAPSTAGRARFGPLLNMLPHPPEEGPYHLEGRLISPSVS